MSEPQRRIVWPRAPFATEASESAPNSLFLGILDWMLAPLLLVWPISIALTNHYAHQIADDAFDGGLMESVHVLSHYLSGLPGGLPNPLPAPVQVTLSGDGVDSRYYRISAVPLPSHEPANASSAGFQDMLNTGVAPASRESAVLVATGYDVETAPIPLIRAKDIDRNGAIRLRDDVVNGESVRVAFRLLEKSKDAPLLIQVAETRTKREALVSRILLGVLMPQFMIIPLAVALTFYGLSRGLGPLRRLRELILERRPGDLSPLSTRKMPEEVTPVLQALNGMMQRLESNLQAQQRFVADAAHQLRTPLTGLKTQIDLAAAEADPERQRHALRLAGDSADRAAHLVRQLLTLARAEASHEKTARFEPVDLRALARTVTLEWVERALKKDIDLGFECSDWPHMTEGVPLLLREMLSNLIDNAIKYTPPKGRVTVRIRQSEFVVLEVEDTGPGIPDGERRKVFERFYRVLGNEEPGSGLGLPIVQEIVDFHRARIEVLNNPGGGSLFRVSMVRLDDGLNPAELHPD